jgi:ATP-dependent DNA helicase RecG
MNGGNEVKNKQDIIYLIDQLDHCIADDLEGQDLDFKQWAEQSVHHNIQKMIRYAVCMANGGGGSVVFGIADKVCGLDHVLTGIPFDIQIDELQKVIYDHTNPHITPVFENVYYKRHTIRILIMHIFPEEKQYMTIDGSATIRQGKQCLPYKNTGQ